MTEKTLIYEKSVAGRTGYSLPETNKTANDILSRIPEKFRRKAEAALPEVSEPIVVRHYVNLSTKNHHIDKGFYPLGSCTMKYNPKLNDVAASFPEFANCHPLMPDEAVQGCLKIMHELSGYLGEVSGFPSISLQPVAGAQGEFTGLMVMRAWHAKLGERRNKVIIPDSAH